MNQTIVNDHLFATRDCVVGHFTWRAPLGSRRSSVIGKGALLVLPSRAVAIEQEGRDRFIADSRTAVIYPARMPYQAQQLESDVESSVFLGIDDRLAAELPPWLPTDEQVVLQRERLVASLRSPLCDHLQTEEMVAALVQRIVETARGEKPKAFRSRCAASEGIREVLLHRYTEPLSLGELASCVAISSFSAARRFRARFGVSIHQYRLNLRLRAAVARLGEGHDSLAALALDLGFSSQSHLNAAFTRAFGVSPARFRRELSSGAINAATMHPRASFNHRSSK